MDPGISLALEAQNKKYTLQEIDDYCEILRWLTCPSCGNSIERLNATMTSEVMSAIFFTQYNKKIKVGCPTCLDKANKNALINSALMGWWGIPWGIIRTVQSINQNMKSKKTNHLETSNQYLRSFALSKIGQLEAYKDNKQKLQQLISIVNERALLTKNET